MNRLIAPVFLALFTFAVSGPVQAQGIGLGFSDQQSDEPIEVEADNGIEWNREESMYVARGNALAVRGNVRIKADVLTALYREDDGGGSKIYRLEALGNVRIASDGEKARGDRAIYDLDQAVVIILGQDLALETEKDVITAEDSLEYWEEKSVAVARGNALATREDKTIRADALTAWFDEKNGRKKQKNNASDKDGGSLDLSKMEAVGNVVIRTKQDVARGESGVYNARTEVATLNGNVRITRGETQLNGDVAEVNMKTGVSRLLSGKKGQDGKSSGRVRGLFVPRKPAGE